MTLDDTIVIDGRQFHLPRKREEYFGAQQTYLEAQLRLAGALDLLRAARADPDDIHAYSGDLFTRILVSGRMAKVLAGFLTEEGKQWSYEEAKRNAARFAATTNAEDKKVMHAAVVVMLLNLFQYVIESAKPSRESSSLN